MKIRRSCGSICGSRNAATLRGPSIPPQQRRRDRAVAKRTGEALGWRLGPVKGEVEAEPTQRNHHNRAEPADMQGGRMARKRPGDEDDREDKIRNNPNPADRKSRRLISVSTFWSPVARPDGGGTGGLSGAMRLKESSDNPIGRTAI